jgi:magnesium-transporting ATPase (P-type)
MKLFLFRKTVGIIKEFPFASALQRMSVIIKPLDQTNFILYTKGSPEQLAEMCKPETSILWFNVKFHAT